MAAIALTIIILLNYLAFYYAYGAFEGSVGTKKRDFFPAKNPVDARREVVLPRVKMGFHGWIMRSTNVKVRGSKTIDILE
jgi:hypothetical protein